MLWPTVDPALKKLLVKLVGSLQSLHLLHSLHSSFFTDLSFLGIIFLFENIVNN